VVVMRSLRSARLLVVIPSAVVVALSGTGAFLEATQGGPGTTAFVIRLILVAIALTGAFLVGIALRAPNSRAGADAGGARRS
jgi:hypothetical protein